MKSFVIIASLLIAFSSSGQVTQQSTHPGLKRVDSLKHKLHNTSSHDDFEKYTVAIIEIISNYLE